MVKKTMWDLFVEVQNLAGEHVHASFPPCGVCRQVLAEFCSPELEVLLAGDEPQKYTLGELLPASFSKKNME